MDIKQNENIPTRYEDFFFSIIVQICLLSGYWIHVEGTTEDLLE